jgi:hypothetical protein
MYTSFSKGGGNTGSCSNLANYLDKEQENGWFNDTEKNIQSEVVVASIDQNGKGQLGKEEWKFIEVEYNPSQKEQQAIIEHATGKSGITDLNQLSKVEVEKVKDEFKEFVKDSQTLQAKNYNRENIKSGSDLVYYGKIETQRKYKGDDPKVKSGEVKQGDLKEGLQMHSHLIQSRKTLDKKKISPLSKHKGQSSKNKIQQGFNRNDFINKVEVKFDTKFEHKRELSETFEMQKAVKKNDLEQIQQLKIEKGITPEKDVNKSKNIRASLYKDEVKEKGKDKKVEQMKEKKQEKNRGNNKGFGY